MSSLILECENCGEMHFRRGYVCITHPDGRKEIRWDYLWIFSNTYGDAENTGTSVEHPLPPEYARALMWFLIEEYMPLFSSCLRRMRYWFFRRLYYPFVHLLELFEKICMRFKR